MDDDQLIKWWADKIFSAHLGETMPLAAALAGLERKIDALYQNKHTSEKEFPSPEEYARMGIEMQARANLLASQNPLSGDRGVANDGSDVVYGIPIAGKWCRGGVLYNDDEVTPTKTTEKE